MSAPIAIVGGGPAGAVAGAQLAAAGQPVVIFDEKLAWEKPCGGGVTWKALQRYRFLNEAEPERNTTREAELISPSGRSVVFPLAQPLAIFARIDLNGFLLDRARRRGCEIVRDRVTALKREGDQWQITSATGKLLASFVVLAAGARNSLRAQLATPFQPSDLQMTAGYFIPGTSDRMVVRFMRGLIGYAWSFPRASHLSLGICGKLDRHSTGELKEKLHAFISEQPPAPAGEFYAHILPSPSADFLRRARFSGPGWAMIGDAAGFVDPLTGEGLYYAFRSAELLADAIITGAPEDYASGAQKDFVNELAMSASISGRFFCGHFLGRPVVERMIEFTAKSSRFRQLMSDLFTGEQGYAGLRARLYRNLIPTLYELARA
jgi:flavin-dependent dehydrogenase